MDLSSLMQPGFTLCGHQLTPECLTIGLIATGSVGTCPQCHSIATRVHSFYQRTLGDVPISVYFGVNWFSVTLGEFW